MLVSRLPARVLSQVRSKLAAHVLGGHGPRWFRFVARVRSPGGPARAAAVGVERPRLRPTVVAAVLRPHVTAAARP